MRQKWNDEKLESELRAIISKIGSWPTVQILKDIKRHDISSQIQRRGGFAFWAKRVGMEVVESDSKKGWEGENELADILISKGYTVETCAGVKSPFDLIVNDLVRLDVKTAKFAAYGPCEGWFFRIGKYPSADLMALFLSDTKEVCFIPWNACPRTNITLTKNGKYKQWINNFEILDKYLKAVATVL